MQMFSYQHNKEQYSSVEDLATTTYFSSTELQKSKKTSIYQLQQKQMYGGKNELNLINGLGKSVTKFKRTNPGFSQSKMQLTPQSGKKTIPLTNQKQIQNDYQNCNHKSSELSLKKTECIPQISINNNNINKTSLKTSRQTAQSTNHYKQQQQKHFFTLHPATTKNLTEKRPELFYTDRHALSKQKYSRGKNEDLVSLKSFKSSRSSQKGSKTGHQDYTTYWKQKAHEYLQRNFTLSQQVQKLKKKLTRFEQLEKKEYQQQCQQNDNFNYDDKRQYTTTTKNNNKSKQTLDRSVPLHIVQLQQKKFMRQIDRLQLENKSKDSMIFNLQNKIVELNRQLKGQKEKDGLMERMRLQIYELERRNQELTNRVIKMDDSQKETNNHRSLIQRIGRKRNDVM